MVFKADKNCNKEIEYVPQRLTGIDALIAHKLSHKLSPLMLALKVYGIDDKHVLECYAMKYNIDIDKAKNHFYNNIELQKILKGGN